MERETTVKTIDTFLVGLGNVNRNFLRILEMKAERLAAEYGLAFRIVAIADSSGVALNPMGFDPTTTRQSKEAGTSRSCVAMLPPPVKNRTSSSRRWAAASCWWC